MILGLFKLIPPLEVGQYGEIMGIGKVAAHHRLPVVSYRVCKEEIILVGKLLVLLIEIEEEVTLRRNGGNGKKNHELLEISKI